MDTHPQSEFVPFNSRRPQDLASVNNPPKGKRRPKRRKKKNRKFGKELQNRGDLVYVRKDPKLKPANEQSTAETDKRQDSESTQEKVSVQVHSKANPLLSEEFVRKGSSRIIRGKPDLVDLVDSGAKVAKEGPKVRANPQNVEIYRERIVEYLLQKDQQKRVAHDYLESVESLNEKRRGVLVDWLVNVAVKFKVLDETVFSAVWIMDRFFARDCRVQKDQLQLVCITCLMISAKMEEVYPPSMADYVEICDKAYSPIDLLDMEAHILSVLQFDITVTTSLHLFRFFCRDLNISKKSFFFGEYLLHSLLLDVKSLRFTQNELASAAIFLVNKMFKEKIVWAPHLSEATCVGEKRVKTVAKEAYKIFKKVNAKDWAAVKEKFSRVEVMEVAKFKVERVSRSAKS